MRIKIKLPKLDDVVGVYGVLLLLFIFPLAFGVLLGWRWGVFVTPFFHLACVILTSLNNGSNTKTNN